MKPDRSSPPRQTKSVRTDKSDRPAPPREPRDARDFAILVIRDVVWSQLALDERLERLGAEPEFRALSPSDRGLTRAICLAAVRGLGVVRGLLAERMRDGMPINAGHFEAALIVGVTQLLFLDVPDYAAVDTTISKLRQDRRSERYVSLANGVLRSIARARDEILDKVDPLADNTPEWLATRWTRAYGEDLARDIADAHTLEPPLDISVKSDPQGWATRLGGTVLASGTVRTEARGAIPDLDGFSEGAWWVQDAAAALPAHLLKAGAGDRVLDLCAAPGGKTAQLAAMGASVVAVDRSAPRLKRLDSNLARLGLSAEVHVCDALTFTAEPFSHILLDAPCSATGTIRRHPDVAWNKTLEDVASLTLLQSRLLDKAWSLLQPGGRLVYATCSLEPEEGEFQVRDFLTRTGDAALVPLVPQDLFGFAQMVTSGGMMRALPCHLGDNGGCDGFFAALLTKAPS